MKRIRTATWIPLLACLGVASPTDPELVDGPAPFERCLSAAIDRAQAALEETTDIWVDHTTWEDARRVRSKHYEVRTTRSRAYGLTLARDLDLMLEYFQKVLGTDYTPSEPFQVQVYPALGEYNAFGQSFAEHSSFYGSFFADTDPERPVAVLYDTNLTQVRMWATHSAAHQFVDHAFSRQIPVWVSEGLACYFALFWDNAYGESELRRILASTAEFVPLDDLLRSTLPSYGERTQGRLIELGMLFTYLLGVREDTRTDLRGGAEVQAPFADYLRRVVRGEPPRRDEAQRLLTRARAELERDFRVHYE